jgi:hypothetical protein
LDKTDGLLLEFQRVSRPNYSCHAPPPIPILHNQPWGTFFRGKVTSVTTLTSYGGFVPIFIASRRIKKLQWRKEGRSANGRGDEAEGDARQHVIVEALFRAANRHAPESATKGKRFLIVGERPNDCGAVAALLHGGVWWRADSQVILLWDADEIGPAKFIHSI